MMLMRCSCGANEVLIRCSCDTNEVLVFSL